MNKKTPIALLFIIVIFQSSYGQKNIQLETENSGINKPSVLSTNTFGLFFMRLEGNYRVKKSNKIQLEFNLASGNIWAQPLTVYIPNLEADRNYISQFPWHTREFKVNVDDLNAKTVKIQKDGVIKELKLKLHIPINETSELVLNAKSFLLTGGNSVFTLLTGDRFIENFHNTIAGGDDPFDRRLYPYNQAIIYYKDRYDNEMEINKNDFIFSGLEATYYYYLKAKKLNKKGYYINFGSHLGINTSRYNSSTDLGLSGNILKTFNFENARSLNLGISMGGVYKDVLTFGKDQLNFGTNASVGFLEAILEYRFFTQSKSSHAFGIDFYLQTRLNKLKEYAYVIPTKNGTSSNGWNIGNEGLYSNNNYWTLFYSFSRKQSFTFYIQQDFTVNNNPDLQTGINMKFPF